MAWTRHLDGPTTPKMPRLLRLPEVMELTGLSEGGVYAEMSGGRFPRPVKISRRAVAWREDHLIAWLASREAITSNTLPPAA